MSQNLNRPIDIEMQEVIDKYMSMLFRLWVDGDMHYELMQMDGELSKMELIEMAKEAISK